MTTVLEQRARSGAPRSAKRFSYSPGIDRFRGLSAAMVLLYHAGFGWSHGFYLGVEAFFVLSGFLITGLLVREHRVEGRVDLVDFWARRARRLLPALWLTVAAVFALALLTDLRSTGSVRGEGLASLFYVNNWRQVLADQSYFAAFGGAGLLRHTWSVAVEEHFYLLWPPALAALLAWRGGRRRPVLAAVLGGLAALILWGQLVFDPARVDRFYMGSDTRFPALIVGCVVALVLEGRVLSARAVRVLRGIFWPGAVGFVAGSFLLDEGAALTYRGGLLAFDLCVAAMLPALVAPGSGAAGFDGKGRTGSTVVLGAPLEVAGRVMRRLGLLSYGLYLYHWPVYLFLDEERTGLAGVVLFGVRAAVTFGLSELSLRFVEEPVRRARWTPATTLRVAAIATVALIVVMLAAPADGPAGGSSSFEDRVAESGQVILDGQVRDPDGGGGLLSISTVDPVGWSGSPATTSETVGEPVAALPTPVTAAPAPLRIGLVGDSSASSLGWGFAAGLQTGRISGAETYDMTLIGCGLVTGQPFSSGSPFGTQEDYCASWSNRWSELVSGYDPDVTVVVLGPWEVFDWEVDGVRYVGGTPEHAQLVRERLSLGLDVLTAGGGKVALVSFVCVSTEPGAFPGGLPERQDPVRVDEFNALLQEAATARADVEYLDLREAQCPGGVYDNELSGVTLFDDGTHYTVDGGLAVWEWLLPQLHALVD